jgi:hypothetical protein
LGTFLLAGVLGTVWGFTLIVVVADSSPPFSLFPIDWRPLAIRVVLTALLSGGVWLAATAGRGRSGLALSVRGLLVALVCVAIILALTAHFYPTFLLTPYGWLLTSVLAGAVGIVVTYLVAGLRVAPPPYQRYANLGCGVASWFLATALTLPVPDQGFTTLALLGLPFAALGGLVGGALYRAFPGSASQHRPSQTPRAQVGHGAQDEQARRATGWATTGPTRPAASNGLAWRLIVAGLLGAVAVPFGPGEPVTLVYSVLVLGFFAAIAIVLDLSLLGWRPGLILLLGCAIAIAWGGGAAILQATDTYLFYGPTGAVPQGPFEAFVGICALLCLLAVDGAQIHAGRELGEPSGMAQLARRVVFWLAAGLFCWLGVAAILLWRGAPGMVRGSETPGQLPLDAALLPVLHSLPAALLGAIVGGALRWALVRGEVMRRPQPVV